MPPPEPPSFRQPVPWRRLATLLGRAVMVLISIGAGLLLGEVLLRKAAASRLDGVDPTVRQNTQTQPRGQEYSADTELDWIPVFGPGPTQRSPWGTFKNEYVLDAKSPDRSRLLFIGDSVTARGFIVDALRTQYGDDRFEYWNGGVEGYSLLQVVGYYLRFTRHVAPDHVIFTLHWNDFNPTPVVVETPEGATAFMPRVPRQQLNLTLFRHSYLYRFLVARLMTARTAADTRYDRRLRDEGRHEMARLKESVATDNITLSVILLPILSPRADWSTAQKMRYGWAQSLCVDLDLRCFELRFPLMQALADQVAVQQRDNMHPSREAATYFAAYLRKQRLLAPPPHR